MMKAGDLPITSISSVRSQAAVMFTDIVSYSGIMSQDEQRALYVMRKNRSIQKSLVEKYLGEWVKEIGDGVLATFASAVDSQNCALEIQKEIRDQCDHKVRIGINLADIVIEDKDAFGDGVNIASRIQSIADPGGIYISESVYESIEAHCRNPVIDLGEVYLKNIVHPVRVFALAGEGLPLPTVQVVKQNESGNHESEPIIGEPSIGKFFTSQSNRNADYSIAVLPFKNLSEDHENQYFADGLMWDILNNLQLMHELRVISQTSVEQYRNTIKPASQIGAELSVSYLLEGSVRKAGDQIMIAARLIHARDDRHIWANNFRSIYSTKGIFDIQRGIAEKIASELQLNITPEKVAEITQPKTESSEAYDHYLNGMFHWYKMTPGSIETALHYFDLARKKDPNYALAYAGIALAWGGYLQHGLVSSEEALPKVKEAAAKALALDNSLVEVHYMLALVMQNGWWEWNWEVAEREFKITLELNPNFAEARIYYAHLLSVLGRSEEAKFQANSAMEIEPFNPVIQAIYAMHLNLVSEYEKSIKVLNNVLASDQNNPLALSTLRSTYHNLEMYDEALETWKKSFTAKGDDEAVEKLEQGRQEGGYSMALQRIAELLIARSENSFISPWQIGTLYTRAGIKKEAINWLEKAYENNDPNTVYISIDPIFDELRGESRFKELLNKMKLP